MEPSVLGGSGRRRLVGSSGGDGPPGLRWGSGRGRRHRPRALLRQRAVHDRGLRVPAPGGVDIPWHGAPAGGPGGQAFFQVANVFFRDVITNPETGRWFVVSGHVLAHDIQATQVEGAVYEFVTIEAGEHHIEDSGRAA